MILYRYYYLPLAHPLLVHHLLTHHHRFFPLLLIILCLYRHHLLEGMMVFCGQNHYRIMVPQVFLQSSITSPFSSSYLIQILYLKLYHHRHQFLYCIHIYCYIQSLHLHRIVCKFYFPVFLITTTYFWKISGILIT